MQPSDLEGPVNGQSWEWLFDLPLRLNVVVELIDDRQAPVFPPRATPAATTVRRFITEREPALMAAIADARRVSPTSRVVVDGFQALCVRMASLGVLVLAAEPIDKSADEGWRDLELVGSWLVQAIEASVTAPPDALSVELYRMASLRRILTDAVSRTSVRKVIGAFVEALGVWDDVRVDAYAPCATRGFFRYVSPMAAPVGWGPLDLDETIAPRANRMTRCSHGDLERIGLGAESGDVLVLRIPIHDVSWVLLFSGRIDEPEQVRLALYADMLRESLNQVTATATDRVVAPIAQDALPPNDLLIDATQALIKQLAASVGCYQSAVVVTAAGRQTLAVGQTELLHELRDRDRPDRLVVTSSDPRSSMTAVLAREQPRFTAFERALVQAAVSALHPNVQRAIDNSRQGERRQQFRPVDRMLDELAAETVGAGQPASVIVVSVDATALEPGVLQAWVGRVRQHLRAGDIAGILSHTEIAVLLSDASADDAAVVAARLKQVLQSDDAGALVTPVFRTTTRMPEAAFEGSLVDAARTSHASAH
jgi:hypothetical protein